jgi:hypothetical protein
MVAEGLVSRLMDTKTQELVRLIDEAIDEAQGRLSAKRAGRNDPSTEEGLEQIISALQYRRNEAANIGYEVSNTDIGLGLARAALEYDLPDSALIRKIGDVEQSFRKHFVRH